MKLVDTGKEYIDIEIDNIIYHISGSLEYNCFNAIIDKITIVTYDEIPMSMKDRIQLADSLESNRSEYLDKLIIDLKDCNQVFNTNYSDSLSMEDKINIAKVILDNWNSIDSNMNIMFND